MANSTRAPNKTVGFNHKSSLFTTNTGPPARQRTWEQILGIDLQWKRVWRTLSNNFSNPHDSKAWFKSAHRALRLNSNDKTVSQKKCRSCELTRESYAHFLTCAKLNTLRRLVPQKLQAAGLDLNSFDYPHTRLTCLDQHGEPLNDVQVALTIIHWNALYKHMTKQNWTAKHPTT